MVSAILFDLYLISKTHKCMKKFFLFSLFLSFLVTMNAQNTQGQLTVTATTTTTNVGYAPRNIVAFWIQDSSGKFVKSMLVLADKRKVDLTNWVTATPAGNTIDATTGATQTSHGNRTGKWNGTNASKVLVADGTYTVKMEMTESNSGSRIGTFTFEKGPNAVTLTPSNIPSFTNITISWIPTLSGIEDVKLSKLYEVYPNPTKSSIYVNGIDISEVEILSLNGKSLLKTNEQKVNLSSLVSGTYLVQIQSKLGTVLKKIIKE
jgi:hypothetical protein